MTVTNQTNRVSAVGAGAVLNIPYDFPTRASGDLKVIQRLISTGGETELTEDAAVDGYTATYGTGGGTVTTSDSIAATSQVHVIRDTDMTQELRLIRRGRFNADHVNAAFDKSTKLIIENADQLTRTLKFPDTDPLSSFTDMPNSVDRASKNLTFDSDGKPTASVVVETGEVTFSALGTNIAEAVTSATMRTLLELGAIDVKDFGAKCDGLNDDTAAWEAAMAAFPETLPGEGPSGTIYFDGTCIVTDLDIANHGIRIQGRSKYTARFKLKDGTPNSTYVLSTNNKTGLVLADFRIDGNHSNNTTVNDGFGLYIKGSYYCRFDNIDVRETMGHGFAMVGSPGSAANVFSGCLSSKNEGYGWYISLTWNNTFLSCGAEECTDVGFYDTNLTLNNTYISCYTEQTSTRSGDGLDDPRAWKLGGKRTVLLAPTVANDQTPAVGIEILSTARHITITAPQFTDNPTDIEFASEASSSYTTFIGVRREDITIVNTGNDNTSSFNYGNHITGMGYKAVFYDSAGDVDVSIDRPAGQSGNIWLRTAGSHRWRLTIDDTAEGGHNAGSDFDIHRRADDGIDLGSALFIERSSGKTVIPKLQYNNVVCNENQVVCNGNLVVNN